MELILWNTVSYVLCFLLVFYIAQVSAFLLYPPFCYVSYMCLLIISLFFLILSWRLWLSVSLCSRLLWSIPDNVICWVPDVNLRLSRWFTRLFLILFLSFYFQRSIYLSTGSHNKSILKFHLFNSFFTDIWKNGLPHIDAQIYRYPHHGKF